MLDYAYLRQYLFGTLPSGRLWVTKAQTERLMVLPQSHKSTVVNQSVDLTLILLDFALHSLLLTLHPHFMAIKAFIILHIYYLYLLPFFFISVLIYMPVNCISCSHLYAAV